MVLLPIVSRMGMLPAIRFLSPPTVMVSIPLCAPEIPLPTGESIKRIFFRTLLFPFDAQKLFPYTTAIQREVLILKTERRVS